MRVYGRTVYTIRKGGAGGDVWCRIPALSETCTKAVCAALFSCAVLVLGACVAPDPGRYFQITQRTLQNIQAGERILDAANAKDVLAACVGVLQDMDYNVDVTSPALGLVVGSKTWRKERSGGAMFLESGISALFGLGIRIQRNSDQKTRVMVTVTQVKKGTHVRVLFQRTVHSMYSNSDGTRTQETHYETLYKPDLYKQFFSEVSKSLFLNTNRVGDGGTAS